MKDDLDELGQAELHGYCAKECLAAAEKTCVGMVKYAKGIRKQDSAVRKEERCGRVCRNAHATVIGGRK